MAQGLVDAVRRIAGDSADALIALSNDGKSPPQMKTELDEAAGDGPVVVFADLNSGSCCMAALSSCRDANERVVVCGVNLPMLLDFVFHQDVPLAELVPRLVDRGQDGIRLIPGKA